MQLHSGVLRNLPRGGQLSTEFHYPTRGRSKHCSFNGPKNKVTGGHYVFGQNSNHCSSTLCNHIDMKSGMHDQCSFLFLGAEVHHHRSAVPVRSTRALPGPHHDCSRHLLLKENLDNAVLVARLLIRVDFPLP